MKAQTCTSQVNIYDNKSLSELEIRAGDILGFSGDDIENTNWFCLIKANSSLSRGFISSGGINLEFKPNHGRKEKWNIKVYEKVLGMRSSEAGDPFVDFVPKFEFVRPLNPNGSFYTPGAIYKGWESIIEALQKNRNGLAFYADFFNQFKKD